MDNEHNFYLGRIVKKMNLLFPLLLMHIWLKEIMARKFGVFQSGQCYQIYFAY